jgi:hypothetical protein
VLTGHPEVIHIDRLGSSSMTHPKWALLTVKLRLKRESALGKFLIPFVDGMTGTATGGKCGEWRDISRRNENRQALDG